MASETRFSTGSGSTGDKVFACPHCDHSFRHMPSLMRHRRLQHNDDVRRKSIENRSQLTFQTLPEFMEWKAAEEASTTSSFVKLNGDKKNGDKSVLQRYYCHRSGQFKPEGHGVRRLKIQGSCKIGDRCPAKMSVNIRSDGTVRVAYDSKHCNHECELAHQPISKNDRLKIAEMLSAGVPFDDVLNKIQRSGSNDKVSRQHLICRQDLLNITRDFKICKEQVCHTNDAESVAAWISHSKNCGENTVRYVKFQGEQSENGLKDEDFLLILMTDAQVVGARQFCGAMKQVALDSTHRTNAYDFQLTTILCVDDHGEGFPIAFCYSNKVDECSMGIFLEKCKEAIGKPLVDIILMTDDTNVYFNAWLRVMGPPAQRLLCVWHVDRAWRRNLNKITGDQVLKATVYKTLRSLMELMDKEAFYAQLEQFTQMALDDINTRAFGTYFVNEYAARPELWAYSHHLGLHVHHNMHLEALHRVLKHVHMQGRKVHRMDKSIHALMALLQSKMSDRLLKTNKGKWNRHAHGIRKRHQRSLSLDTSLVTCVEENKTYAVHSQDKKTAYIVEVNSGSACESIDGACPLSCSECYICAHSVFCSCEDSGLHSTICKHVHLVMRAFHPIISFPSVTMNSPNLEVSATEEPVPFGQHLKQDTSSSDNYDIPEVQNEETVTKAIGPAPQQTETKAILKAFTKHQPVNNLNKAAQDCQQLWSSIWGRIEAFPEFAPTVCEQLKRLQSMLPAVQSRPQFPTVLVREPVHKIIQKQRHVGSTKRKAPKRKHEATLSKPTAGEKVSLMAAPDGTTEVVSGDNANTDHDYDVGPADIIHFEHRC